MLAQVLGLLFFATPLGAIAGFPLDDAWIHQVVARTFASSGTLGYSPGHHGAAASSWLWAVVLSLNFKFIHVDPFAFTLAVNATLSLVGGQLLLRCFRGESRDRAETVTATAAVILGCSGGNYLWFAFCGMESNLVLVLSLLVAILWVRARGLGADRRADGKDRSGALLSGVAAGALALTRPECAAMGLLLPLWRRRARRDAVDVACALGPWAVALAGYLGLNLVRLGHAAPSTFAGRRWLWLSGAGTPTAPGAARDFLFTVAHRLRDYTLGTSATFAFWIGLGMCSVAYVVLWRADRHALTLILAWTGVHVAVYALVLPSPGHGGRYLPLVPLLYLAGVGYGSIVFIGSAVRIAGRRLPPRSLAGLRALSGAAALGPWVGLVGVGVRDWRVDHADAVSHIRVTEEGLGPLVDGLPSGAAVASFDIGGVGYHAKRPIADLGGLSDESTVEHLRRGTIWQMLVDQRIRFVILPVDYNEHFPSLTNFGYRLRLFENPAITLELVSYLESPMSTWFRGMQATWNSSPRQAIYRVTSTGRPGPKPVSPPLRRSVVDPDGLLTGPGRACADTAIGTLAAEGLETTLRLTRERISVAGAGPANAARVALGPWGTELAMPVSAARPQDDAGALLAERVEPYLLVQDYDGAALAATHVISEVVRTRVEPTFLPLLPPLAGPSPGGPQRPIESSMPWGVCVALACAAAGIVVARAAERGTVPPPIDARVRVSGRGEGRTEEPA